MRSSNELPLTDLRNVCGMLRNVAECRDDIQQMQLTGNQYDKTQNAKTFHIPQNHTLDTDNEQLTIAEYCPDIPQHSADCKV